MTQRLGRYELLRHLASGGMSRVYLARATGPGGFARHVVVKTIPAERRDDDAFIAMFLDEARLVATLHHQHIAQVFEVGRADDGTYFFAMEYLHGETVRELLETARKQRVKLSLEVGLSIASATAAGLHHAHERRDQNGTPLGIVHRDISPSNLILGYDGSIKLIDFGIAKANSRSAHTATGFVKGKAGYMAPEQARGYEVDRRSDVFALGVLAYELTTQTRAFHADSQFESMRRTMRGDIEPPSRRVADYPPALEDVIMTALELDPDDRFQDAEAMRVAFEQIARELGLTLGHTPVLRALERLFPPRAEPWLAGTTTAFEEEPLPELGDLAPELRDSEPMIVIVPRTPTRVRLARGTETATRDADQDRVPALDTLDLTTQPYERLLQQARSNHGLAAMTGSESMTPPTHRPSPSPLQLRPALSELSLPLPPTRNTPTPVEPPFVVPPLVPTLPRTARATSTLYVLFDQRRRTLTIAAAALAALGLILIAFAISGDDRHPANEAAPPATAPEPVRPSPPPVPTPRAVPAPAAVPADTAQHDTVLLHVTTEPKGATVVLDGVRLGTTPLSTRVPTKASEAWLKVRKRGHAAVKTRVSLERNVHWDVELRTLAP